MWFYGQVSNWAVGRYYVDPALGGHGSADPVSIIRKIVRKTVVSRIIKDPVKIPFFRPLYSVSYRYCRSVLHNYQKISIFSRF